MGVTQFSQSAVCRRTIRAYLAPGSTTSCTKGITWVAASRSMRRNRMRPNPLGSTISTAMTINTLVVLLLRPAGVAGFLRSVMDRYVSSTSTSPLSLSRPGRTMARRNRCSMVQAVW